MIVIATVSMLALLPTWWFADGINDYQCHIEVQIAQGKLLILLVENTLTFR